MRPAADAALVQLVDTALADAARRAGPYLFCHAGCTPCCHGVFAISSLDAARLNDGFATLKLEDPIRASVLSERIELTQLRLAPHFPGDPETGHLATDEISQQHFEDFANDEPCPVLDAMNGTCDLYASRPMTCRAFGPPVRSEGGLGICELCFHGATTEEVAAAELHLPDHRLEASLTADTGNWTTIVAFAFQPQSSPRVSDTEQRRL